MFALISSFCSFFTTRSIWHTCVQLSCKHKKRENFRPSPMMSAFLPWVRALFSNSSKFSLGFLGWLWKMSVLNAEFMFQSFSVEHEVNRMWRVLAICTPFDALMWFRANLASPQEFLMPFFEDNSYVYWFYEWETQTPALVLYSIFCMWFYSKQNVGCTDQPTWSIALLLFWKFCSVLYILVSTS